MERADPKDAPLGWRGDGRVLFVRQGRLPARIFAVDVPSGERTLVREISPRDLVGVDAIGDIRLMPDGKSYAYCYIRSLYGLYQVSGSGRMRGRARASCAPPEGAPAWDRSRNAA